MELAAHAPAERFVHQLVLRDAALAGERGGKDVRCVVIAVTCQVADFYARVGAFGQTFLDIEAEAFKLAH